MRFECDFWNYLALFFFRPLSRVLGCHLNHSVARKANLEQETLMSLPDGPKSPRIWQMLHWITMPFSFMQGCNDRYGDCFTASIGEKLSNFAQFEMKLVISGILSGFELALADSRSAGASRLDRRAISVSNGCQRAPSCQARTVTPRLANQFVTCAYC
jgi:hypothetical protein